MTTSHFRTIQTFKVEYSPSSFIQYESTRTGMRVVVVEQKGPNVYGRFALATEIHDDSGAPHTLEHLCFMGSMNYSYKGVLDNLATRAYSSTNAWTAIDHTAYTLDTAGWEAFAQILPVYLEHVLLPTLTDAGCYTEVHHIDGTGSDAGVVYSEMQALQNDQDELMELKNQRLLYPEGVGFRYETGGMMEQLRVLTAERIREFHREMYQPKNLCLVIVGEVDHENLLVVLDKFEDTILDYVPKPDSPFKRPWVDSKQAFPLDKTIVEIVHFPEEDESKGEILISFLGPNGLDTFLSTALDIALIYLTESSASVLKNTLVEKEQLCSDISTEATRRPITLIEFSINSVDTEALAKVEARFFEVLKEAASSELDIDYMRNCIRRTKRHLTYYAEDNASVFVDDIIRDHIFDKRDGSGLLEYASLKQYDELEKWSSRQWREFIRNWLVDAHHTTIFGVPSEKLSKQLKKDEETRIAEQRKRLGDNGLKELEKKLANAKAENEKEIPKELLARFKVPGTESIHFINTTTARSGAALEMGHPMNGIQNIIDSDAKGSNVPLFIHYEHIPSNFVKIRAILSTNSIPVQLRPLLAIYLENFFSTPIKRDGNIVSFEQVLVELERDTVQFYIDSGSYIGNPEVLAISIVVESAKYATAIHWLKELTWDSVFDQEASSHYFSQDSAEKLLLMLVATTVKLLAGIPDEKRDGSTMAAAVDVMMHLGKESIGRARGTLTKALYLKRILRLLKGEPEKVISQLEEIRREVFRFENFRVLVVGNIERLSKPVSSWESFVKTLDTSKPVGKLEKRLDRLTEAGKAPGSLAYIVPMSTIDSSFAYTTAKGVASYDDSRLPALMVAIAYLDAVEGPLWTSVRGSGLAYGTNFSRSVDSGLLQFNIYRSPDANRVLETSKKTIEDFATGAAPFDEFALEGAVSSIVVGFADEQSNMQAAATSSFTRQAIKGLPRDWNEQMLKKVRAVKVEEIKSVLKEVILPTLTPGTADVVITCAPVIADKIKQGLEEKGFKPEIHPLTYFQDDYGLKAAEGEDDGSDEDGEEDDEEGTLEDGSAYTASIEG
ncbi:MAG: hypothetical protein M1834_006254 [Cirrosporium novae-zelandiae]|nr:MAG: hypothetical protein M1834_006254 [Cirrosporium novae-zelandiae]